jgi:hypothetical protein
MLMKKDGRNSHNITEKECRETKGQSHIVVAKKDANMRHGLAVVLALAGAARIVGAGVMVI